MAIMNIWQQERTWVLLDQVVFSATSFLGTLFLARALGVSGFGQYSAIVLFLYLMLSISNALLIGPYQVGMGEFKDQKAYDTQVVLMQFALCAAMSSTTAVLYPSIAPRLGLPGNLRAAVLVMMNGFILQDLFRKMLLAQGQPRKALIVDATGAFSQVLLFGIVYRQGPIGVQQATLLSGISFMAAAVPGLSIIGLVIPAAAQFRQVLRWHVDNGRWLLLTSFLQWCSNNLLIATAGIWISIKALGALRLAQSLFGILNALLQVLENYALPKAAACHRQGPEDLGAFLFQLTKKTMLLLLPVLLVMLLLPSQVFGWAGGEAYVEYAYALQGMAILYAIIFLGYPFRIAIRVMRMNRQFFIAYCLSFAFTLATTGYLVNAYQLYGVIIALVTNQALMITYWHYSLSKKQFTLWK